MMRLTVITRKGRVEYEETAERAGFIIVDENPEEYSLMVHLS